MDIASKVCEVISDFDQNFVGEITGDLTLRNDLAWDSMDLVGIVDCLVECFNLPDPVDVDLVSDMLSVQTVSDLIAYVEKMNPTTYHRLVFEDIGGSV